MGILLIRLQKGANVIMKTLLVPLSLLVLCSSLVVTGASTNVVTASVSTTNAVEKIPEVQKVSTSEGLAVVWDRLCFDTEYSTIGCKMGKDKCNYPVWSKDATLVKPINISLHVALDSEYPCSSGRGIDSITAGGFLRITPAKKK
jgi:hypothetical protein